MHSKFTIKTDWASRCLLHMCHVRLVMSVVLFSVGETGARSPTFGFSIIAARLRKLEASILVGLLGYSSAYKLQCYSHR